MPIRPENKDRYPKDWPAIAARIRKRDGNACKWCKVPNGELGGRDGWGTWLPALPFLNDAETLEFPEPGEIAECAPRYVKSPAAIRSLRIVRIVLTVAHLNHKPEDCRDENLAALCQRCHNRYDGPMRRAGMRARAFAQRAIGDLFG